MTESQTPSQLTAQLGRDAVVRELVRRGWAVRQVKVDGRTELLIERRGARRRLRVSTKRVGTWQTSTTYGSKIASAESIGRIWVFVDLSGPRPDFFVVPEDWMIEDIYEAHRKYLGTHGGTRARSPKSTHHAIRAERIHEWRDRWDLLKPGKGSA